MNNVSRFTVPAALAGAVDREMIRPSRVRLLAVAANHR